MAQTHEPDNDAALVAQSRAGNAAAFEQLVRRHYRTAFAVALAICGTRADAEDVCQDAIIKALEKLDSCRAPDRFGPWLSEIVRNHALNCLDYARVRRAEPLAEDNGVEPQTPDRRTERRELADRLERALATLSPREREVVVLHDLDGWSHKEIGQMIGASEVMSRQLLFTARRALRALLADVKAQENLS